MNEEKGRTVEDALLGLWRTRRTDMLILIGGILFGAYFEWNLVEIFIFLVFLWSLLGPLPSRVLAVPALFFLSATPILLVMERAEQAESFAVYAYYFLVMAVIRGIVELREDPESVDVESVMPSPESES